MQRTAAHFRRAYICRYEGDGVKRGWYITRYKPDVVVDVESDLLRFWKVVIERKRQQEKTASSALLWEVLPQERQGIEQFKKGVGVRTMPLDARSEQVLPACLSRLGCYSAHGLTVPDRYESAMFKAAHARGEIPGC